ncbi:MAG: hypothetical protein AB7T49_10145 [Oligoflexales bacterium]
MKLKFVLGLIMSTSSVLAFAAESPNANTAKEVDKEIAPYQTMFGLNPDNEPGAPPVRPMGPCAEVNLAPEQKAALKDAIFEFRKELITLKAQVKIAKLTYDHTVTDSATLRTDAETVGNQIRDGVTNVIGAKIGFKTKILYDIVTPDQRLAAYRCMKFIERLHRREIGRPGHGRGL